MQANDFQIGGNHYRMMPYAHWDLVLKVDMSYLEGNTTKYVVRWRNKNGLEDLKKAWHYLAKLEEASPSLRVPRSVPFQTIAAEVSKFNTANSLSDLEGAYVAAICKWHANEELTIAREFLSLLMDEAEALEAKPVPLTEENHHAERVPVCIQSPECSADAKRACQNPHCGYSIDQIGW